MKFRLSNLYSLYFIFICAAAYTNLGISLGGRYISGAYLFILSIIFLSLDAGNFRIGNKNNRAAIAFCIIGVWAIGIMFDPSFNDNLDQVQSLVLMFSSLFLVIAIFTIFEKVGADALRKRLHFLVLLVIFGCILEVYTPFNTDSARSMLYGDSFLYASDDRDFQIAGKLRPKLFTQEPSHIAKFLAFSICSLGFLTNGRYAYIIGLFLVSAYLTGSPTIIFGLFTYALGIHFINFRESSFQMGLSFLVVVLFIFSYLNLPFIAGLLPFERAQMIASGQDASAILRNLGPAEISIRAMIEYPLFGAGIGAKELVQPIVVDTYAKNPIIFIERIILNPGSAGWGAAFFELFVFGGFFVTSIIITLTAYFFKSLTGFIYMPMAAAAIILLSDSGFVAPRVWFYIGLVLVGFHFRAIGTLDRRDVTTESGEPRL